MRPTFPRRNPFLPPYSGAVTPDAPTVKTLSTYIDGVLTMPHTGDVPPRRAREMPDTAETVTGTNVQVWTDGDGLSHPQSPGWTAPQPGERKNAYGYAVPMSTLQMVLLAAASALIGTEQMVGPGADEDERARAAWWSICNSLERGDRVALQRECVERYGDLPAGPWEDA